MSTTALVAVELAIGPDTLAGAGVYREHLERSAARALDGVTADARLLVFPELAGHLALYALAPAAARRAKTLSGALALAAARRPLAVLRGAATSRRLGARAAVLAALAPEGERWWKAVFGPLARRHAAYVVAGSHLRLGPDGELSNSSLLFDPEGRLLATTDKVNLVPGKEDAAASGLGLARGRAEDLPVTDTALGRIATWISYDAFRQPHSPEERFEPLGARLVGQHVRVIAHPAANPWGWSRDEWQTDGLPATLHEHACARYGVTAHLLGQVLDLAFDGESQVLERMADGSVRRLGRTAIVEQL